MEIIRFQKIYPHNLIQDGLVSGGRFSVWRDIWRSVVLGSISNSLDIIRAILHVHAIPNYSSAFGREWGEVYCPLSALQLLAGSGGGPSSFLHFQLTLIILSRSRYWAHNALFSFSSRVSPISALVTIHSSAFGREWRLAMTDNRHWRGFSRWSSDRSSGFKLLAGTQGLNTRLKWRHVY